MDTLLNPLMARCAKCKKKIYLRQSTIYDICPKMTVSVLHYILELFTENNNNVIDITKRIQEKYNRNDLDNRFIYLFISTIRNYLAHIYRYKYTLEKSAYLVENKKCAIDESLFAHIDGKKLWIIGIIDTESLNIRIEASFEREREILQL